MLNLCLVVISSHFAETKERELTKMKLERRENCSASVADTELMSKSIYTQIIQYFVHLYRLSRQQLLKFYRAKIVHFSKNRRDNTTIEEDQLKSLNINPSCAKHGNLVRQALIENPKVVLRFNEQQTANYTTSATPAMSQQREQSSPTGKLMFLEKFLKNYFISFFLTISQKLQKMLDYLFSSSKEMIVDVRNSKKEAVMSEMTKLRFLLIDRVFLNGALTIKPESKQWLTTNISKTRC